MQLDQDFLEAVKPTNPADRFVVRRLSGGLPMLERLLNILPDDWDLLHVVGTDCPVVIFQRDPDEAPVA
jgi:hypothetical protein